MNNVYIYKIQEMKIFVVSQEVYVVRPGRISVSSYTPLVSITRQDEDTSHLTLFLLLLISDTTEQRPVKINGGLRMHLTQYGKHYV